MKASHLEHRLLVVDDDAQVLRIIQTYLEHRGCDVAAATSCEEARERLAERAYDAAIIDYALPDGTAFDVLAFIKERELATPSVVLTGQGSIELAVGAMRAGAEHFLCKPVKMHALEEALSRSFSSSKTKPRPRTRHKPDPRRPTNPFVGDSAAISRLARLAPRVTHAASPVLLQGETGTGKTILARWLHAAGPRKQEPFVEVNCASFPEGLLEAELFGYERGAFTGAVSNKAGLFEAADRGTLFLDEIGDLPATMQPKLLKVLEEGRVRRVGSLRPRPVDVRIIAASNRDLRKQAEEGSFRTDLYYRLSAVPLTLPALRERSDDIGELARLIMSQLSTELGMGQVELSPDVLRALSGHAWPGNIRELRNVLERMLLFGPIDGGLGEALPSDARDQPLGKDLSLLSVERRHIEQVLELCAGNVTEAARILEIPRSTLYQKLKRMTGGSSNEYRRSARKVH